MALASLKRSSTYVRIDFAFHVLEVRQAMRIIFISLALCICQVVLSFLLDAFSVVYGILVKWI